MQETHFQSIGGYQPTKDEIGRRTLGASQDDFVDFVVDILRRPRHSDEVSNKYSRWCHCF